MNKKIGLAVAAIFFIICAVMTVKNLGVSLPLPNRFSSVELIYENPAQPQGLNMRYYYRQLSSNAKIAYTLIVPEIPKHTERIEIPRLSDSELDAVMYAISYDNPELICYGSNCQMISERGRTYFVPSYTHTAESHDQYINALENTVQNALLKMPVGDDFKKELYIHDLICNRCHYLNDNNGDLRTSAYNALVTGEAVCEGYAREAQLLMNRAGIRNYLVTGESLNSDGETVGHMWNVVEINSKNYYLDVTWDDADASEVGSSICYFYFNVNEELISKDHFKITPSDNGCDSLFDNYYSKNNRMFFAYDGSVRSGIIDTVASNVRKGDSSYDMIFTSHEAYEKMKSELLDTGDIVEVISEINRKQSVKTLYKVEYEMYETMDYIRFVFK